ncbi:MAG TPA: tripartite tricarboxylate transporter substrate binding protein [Chloroflexota bacterium]|nr:tripartite tricarboxylate transporter substrate binding protein [Chloroflexota bacterium]
MGEPVAVSRRTLLCWLAGVMGASACRRAVGPAPLPPRGGGETVPTGEQTITIVVPWAPGGASDLLLRATAEHLQRALGQPVAVQNVTGGGGTIGARQVLSAPPDGSTLLAAHESLITAYYTGVAPFSWRDFEPVALLFSTPEVIATRASAPWSTFDALLGYARQHPDTVRWGATFGSTSHFLASEITYRTGARFRLIGYEGIVERLEALLAAQIDVATCPAANLLQLPQAAQLRALAIAGVERDHALAEVPTLHEYGLAVTFTTNRGLFAPRGTPEPTLQRLERAVERALADPELVQRVQDELHTHIHFLGRAEYLAELERWDSTIHLLAEQIGFVRAGRRRYILRGGSTGAYRDGRCCPQEDE